MFSTISFLTVFAPLACRALTISAPTGNPTSGGTAHITWTNDAGDPPTWSLELVNPSQFHNAIAIANNVIPASGEGDFALPIVPAGDGYTLQAVDISNITDVFATSPDFSIGAVVSSSSSTTGSASGSGTGSSSSTHPPTFTPTPTTSFGVTVTPTSTNTTPTSAGSGSSSSSGSAASGSPSSFNAASSTRFSFSSSNAAAFVVMLLSAIAGAAVVGL